MAADPSPHEDLKSYTMLSVSAVFLVVSAITVALRMFVRASMIRSMGWDDWLMLATWALFAVLCGLLMDISVIEITRGVADSAVVSQILTYVVCVFGLYILTTVIFKLSLAIFFLRVVNRPWHRRIIIASVTLYTLFGTAWLFVAVFQCGNPALYVSNEVEGKCLPFKTVLRPLNYIHGVLNALTDWIFAIVPIFVVRGAQMPKQAKVGVCIILVLGVLGSVCSIVRLAYVDVIGVPLSDLLTHAPDYAIVSIVELGLGITAACLATLRPLFSSCLGKARTSHSSSRNKATKALPQGIDKRDTKGVSAFQATSGNHGVSIGFGKTDNNEDDGVVTVTRELEIFSHRSSRTEGMELYDIPVSRDQQDRVVRSALARDRSHSVESGERSLLQTV